MERSIIDHWITIEKTVWIKHYNRFIVYYKEYKEYPSYQFDGLGKIGVADLTVTFFGDTSAFKGRNFIWEEKL